MILTKSNNRVTQPIPDINILDEEDKNIFRSLMMAQRKSGLYV